MMNSLKTFLLLLGASCSLASPLASRSVTSVSVSELNSFAPFTQFARAAYCGTSKVQNWNCGEACAANSDFQPTKFGGDGNAVPYWYVGYWPSKNAVVVAHEGTDPTQFKSLLTDANIAMTTLDGGLFPGIPSVEVHAGFAAAHASTAGQVLGEVKNLISSKGAKTVYAIGHSLGGAIAELDTLLFTLNLDKSIAINGITYGTPRVGNPDFATYFDTHVSSFKRINNEKDLIPILPGRFLGFSHVQGEIHITEPDHAVACSGDDDASDSQCTISTVPNIFVGDILNHLGPYQGISLGTIYCF